MAQPFWSCLAAKEHLFQQGWERRPEMPWRRVSLHRADPCPAICSCPAGLLKKVRVAPSSGRQGGWDVVYLLSQLLKIRTNRTMEFVLVGENYPLTPPVAPHSQGHFVPIVGSFVHPLGRAWLPQAAAFPRLAGQQASVRVGQWEARGD